MLQPALARNRRTCSVLGLTLSHQFSLTERRSTAHRPSLRFVLLVIVVAGGLSLQPLVLHSLAEAAGDRIPVVIRVGVVEYDNLARRTKEYFTYLQSLAKAAQPHSLTFRLALGTYSEVFHWFNNEAIDVAVLTPGLVAQLLASDRELAKRAYIATKTLPPATDAVFTEPDRARKGRAYDYYHAAAIVHAESSLNDIDDLVQRAKVGRLRFLVTHPSSLSSFIYPSGYLAKWNIRLGAQPIEFTYSHETSIRQIAERVADRESLVAFVYDGMDPTTVGDALRHIKKLDLEGFSQQALPQGVVLANFHSPGFEAVRDVLRPLFWRIQTGALQFGNHLNRTSFGTRGPWHEGFEHVLGWLKAAEISATDEQGAELKLSEVKHALTSRTSDAQQRLALVLSGGGAKCAYQVGALDALEDELGGLIRLVVGTSGGALNALAVALGVSREPEGRDLLKALWRGFDQRDFIMLWPNSGLSVGIFVGFGLSALVTLFVSHRVIASVVLIAVGLLGVCLAVAPINIHHLSLGHNHWLAHGLALLLLVLLWGAWWLPVIGVIVWCIRSRVARLAFGLAAASIALIGAVVGTYVTLGLNESIMRASGVEHAMIHAVPELVKLRLAREEKGRRDKIESALGDIVASHQKSDGSWLRGWRLPFGSARQYSSELRELSNVIIRYNLLERDLVITGSRLRGRARQRLTSPIADDLYFFARGRGSSSNPIDPRFVPLGSDMLDVIIGSASIFPLFPGRTFGDYTIVDGGFAHNIPVEAAVRWRASHVLVVEASSAGEGPRAGSAFAANTLSAFGLLFSQAQKVDLIAKGAVPLVELRPSGTRCSDEPEYAALDLFDFWPDLVDRAVRLGVSQASCRDRPTYRRVWLSTPNLTTIPRSLP